MSIADRNRKLKKILSLAYGSGKVRVHGSRGTAYGWVSVKIDYTPISVEDRRKETTRVWKLINDNEISIGTYGYDDPGSDYGYGRTIHIDFNDVVEQRKLEDVYGA